MEPVRVAVHAFDPITLAGLTSYLRSRPELVVVERDELTSRDVLVVQADQMGPEVLAELTRQAERRPVPVVLLAGALRQNEIVAAAERHVFAVLPKARASGDTLVNTVRAVADGAGALPPPLLGALLDNIRRLQQDVLSPQGLDATGMTAREVDVLRLIAQGWDTARIANELCYSERTVKAVLYAMTNRLHLRNRPHAVAYAMRAGLI